MPVLFMVGLGVGLGSQIDDAPGELGTASYLAFVAPGLLASGALQTGAGDSMWATLGMIRWGGVYQSVLNTPATASELGVAHILFIGLRVIATSIVFLGVLVVAGIVESPMAVFVPVVAGLIAWVHAAPMVAWAPTIPSTGNHFATINRLVFFPLYLFSGAFFPIDEMPAVLAWIARLTPAWHGVSLTRNLVLDPQGWTDVGHAAVLVVTAAVGFVIIERRWRRHLAS